MTEKNITDMTGKQYLIEQNKADKCKDCSFFRSCWNIEDYNRIDLRRVSVYNSKIIQGDS
jgi:hypothetical protein